jgi:DNA-binding MarR family transcriptional regulator
LARDELCRELAYGLQTEAVAVSELLDQLASTGIVRVPADGERQDGALVELTGEGRALYRAVRESIGRTTSQLFDGLNRGEVDATARLLREVTERAEALRLHEGARRRTNSPGIPTSERR